TPPPRSSPFPYTTLFRSHVIGEVDHGSARRLEVLKRRGLEERLDHDLFFSPLDTHGGEVDRPASVHRGEHGLDDHRTSATGGGEIGRASCRERVWNAGAA